MKAETAKDLMFSSVCFRLILGLAIISGVVAMILGIISTNVTCYHSGSCSTSFYYSTDECKENGVRYCCGSYYDAAMPSYSCGSYYYCYKNPNGNHLCEGLVITARSFMGLALLLLFLVLAMMCHFRRVRRRKDKHSHSQTLLFTSQQQWLRYQQAQNHPYANNQYSINQQPPNSNQYLLHEQNRPKSPRIQVHLHHMNGEIITQR